MKRGDLIPAPPRFPAALSDAAYANPLGNCVRLLAPSIDANPDAVLVQALAMLGAALPDLRVRNGELLRVNLYVLGLGASGFGRKGTSKAAAARIVGAALDGLGGLPIEDGGLSTPEGLLHSLIDHAAADVPEGAPKPGRNVVLIEPEFEVVAKRMARQGNPLSGVLRAVYDDGSGRLRTAGNPLAVKDAHLCLIAHSTREELAALATETDWSGGLLNRFVFAPCRIVRALPRGEPDAPELADAIETFREAARAARNVGEAAFSIRGAAAFDAAYLSILNARDTIPARLESAVARLAAHTAKMAAVLASMDRAILPTAPCLIRGDHVAAAAEVSRLSGDTLAWLRGGEPADPVLVRVLNAVSDAGDAGLTRGALRDKLNRNIPATETDRVLSELRGAGAISIETEETGGRPAERIRATHNSYRPAISRPWADAAAAALAVAGDDEFDDDRPVPGREAAEPFALPVGGVSW